MTTTREHILILSTVFWGELPPLSREELARAFVNMGHTVTYVQPPMSFLALRYGTGRARSLFRKRYKVDGVTIVSPRMLLPWHRMGLRGRYDAAVRRAVRINAPTIVWHNDPTMPDVHDLAPDATYIFHRTDQLAALKGTKYEHAQQREHELIKSADLTLSVSEDLRQECEVIGSKHAHLLPNAFDVSMLDGDMDAEAPELAGITGPIAMVTGSINQRLDLDLIRKLHNEIEDLHLVFVGGVRREQGEAAKAVIQELDRAKLLPARPRKDLVPLLKRATIGLIPYVDDTFNRASFPLKTFDYLAIGLPVVSTHVPSLTRFAPHVDVVDTHEAFTTRVQERLNEQEDPAQQQARKDLTLEETWDMRAQQALDLINDVRAAV